MGRQARWKRERREITRILEHNGVNVDKKILTAQLKALRPTFGDERNMIDMIRKTPPSQVVELFTVGL
jgi:hypothetical protein